MDEVLNVKVSADQSSAEAVLKQLQQQDTAVQTLLKSYSQATNAARSFVSAQSQQAEQAAQNAQVYNQSVQTTTQSLDELKSTVTEVTVHVDGLRRAGSALTQLGLTEIGGIVSKADEIQQVYRLVSQFVDILPQVGTYAGALVPILGEANSAFIAEAASVGLMIAPLIALTAALHALQNAAAEQQKMIDDTANALKSATDQRLAEIDAIHNSTAEQIRSIIEVDKAKKQELENELTYQQAYLADIQKQYADLGSSFNPIQRAALGAAGQTAQKSIDDLTARIATFSNEIDTNSNTILPAVEKREAETKAIQDQSKALDDAQKAQQDYAKQLVKAGQDITRINEQIASEAGKYMQILADRAKEDQRAAETSALQQQIDDAKAEEEAQTHRDKIVEIRHSETELDVEEAQKRAEGVAKINQTFMERELSLLNNYRTNEARADEDYSRNRVRKLEDLYTNLTDLAGQRDVAAFVNARNRGLTDITRGDEDFGTAAQRRREDYERQAQEAQTARDQQLQQLNQSLTQETASKKQALEEQYNQELQAEKAHATKSQELEKQLADLQKKYQQEDLAERRRIEDAAHAQTIAKLTAQQQQISAVVGASTGPVVGFFGTVTTSIVNMINQVRAAASGSSAPSSSPPGGSSSHATPAITTNSLPRIDVGRATPQAVNVHIGNVNTGALVTPSEMHQQVNEVVRAVRIAVVGTA